MLRQIYLKTSVPERQGKSRKSWSESVGLQAVNIQFAGDGGGTGSGIVAASADVDLAVGDGGNGELHREARFIARGLGAVPEFCREFGCIKGVKHGWPAAWRLRSAVLAAIRGPYNTVSGCTTRGNGRSG